jgi:lipoprotein-anchoring transpeptidase ErfK/SrfK
MPGFLIKIIFKGNHYWMKNKSIYKVFVCSLGIMMLASACNQDAGKKISKKFSYEELKDSMSIENYNAASDTANIFDSNLFTPGVDSVDSMLIRMDTMWHAESNDMDQQDRFKKIVTTTEQYTLNDKKIIKENIKVLDSFLLRNSDTTAGTCTRTECPLYAEIVKSNQKLYLYIDGDLKDSFKVSTGIKKYDTPEMDLRPAGPVLTKYTSRKFPGGNYQGLGNMPFAVFLKGGYAIHGTTQGNFAKLGTPASHGCIRLHPNNAKLFNELVKRVGLQNTWIRVVDSLPDKDAAF